VKIGFTNIFISFSQLRRDRDRKGKRRKGFEEEDLEGARGG
jgi:hypothetical protein